MSIWRSVLRILALWSLAIWLGGFTVYGAVVIPTLHDQLGSPLETGLVTQHVTDVLNRIGFAVVLLGWLVTGFDFKNREHGQMIRFGSILLLLVMTVSQMGLFVLHRVLDLRLAAGEMAGFYPLHRIYVWLNTLQWAAGMLLLAFWASPGTRKGSPPREENPQVSR
jgi:Domain of unknown function (DUF4149)